MTARDEVLAALATLGPGATDAVTLLGHVCDLATFADQVQGELARLAGMLDAVDGAAEAGYSSTAAFLRHGCGRSSGRAGELVMRGRALRRLDATGKALMAGEISFDAAHIICRAADQITDGPTAEAAEEQMLAFARRRPLPGSGGPRSGPVPDDSGQAADEGHPEQDGDDSGRMADDDRDAEAGGNGPGTAGPDGEPGSDPGGPAAGPTPPWTSPGLDPTQLRRLGEEILYRTDPEAAEERERKPFERRHLSFGFTLENTGTIAGACGDTLSLEIIKTAVHAFGPPLGAEDTRTAAAADGWADRRLPGCPGLRGRRDPAWGRPAPQHPGRRADPGERLRRDRHGWNACRWACRVPGDRLWPPPVTRPQRPEPRACRGLGCRRAEPPAWLGHHPGMGRPRGPGTGPCSPPARSSPWPARADLSVIRWRDGIPLDVGRRYRTETPAIRRALEARDRGCRFTGCGMPAVWSTAHHLKPWSEGGVTSLKDTALFCFVHHHVYIHLLGCRRIALAASSLVSGCSAMPRGCPSPVRISRIRGP